jgi:hypothetical protein
MSSPESKSISPEQKPDHESSESIDTSEQREKLRNIVEDAELKHKEKLGKESEQEEAHREALERAKSLKEVAEGVREKIPAEKRTRLFTKQQRDASFNRQMDAIQSDMTPTSKAFSKLIHNKTIDRTSEAIGSTIARPNALLAGSITAFIVVTILYLITRHYGYHLSGFETIGSFILGWVLGLIYDYVRVLITGKN